MSHGLIKNLLSQLISYHRQKEKFDNPVLEDCRYLSVLVGSGSSKRAPCHAWTTTPRTGTVNVTLDTVNVTLER